MKTFKFSAFLLTTFFLFSCGNAGKILSEAEKALKTVNAATGISQDEAARGLKEALNNGIGTGTDFLSKRDGFFKNATYKILFPSEAQKVEQKLRAFGFGSLCDKAIENINRGAELAVAEAKPVFISAINQLTISDAINIVTGGNGAATAYLKRTTTSQLTAKFSPIIQQSLDKTEGTKYWKDVMTNYNKIPGVEKVNPDLNAYVTGKALEALFVQIELEENKIRTDPAKRATDLLKKVFNYADQQKNR
jgi:hypothetical protein